VAIECVADVATSYFRNFSITGDCHKVQKREVINTDKLINTETCRVRKWGNTKKEGGACVLKRALQYSYFAGLYCKTNNS